jgi:hypothetical protein
VSHGQHGTYIGLQLGPTLPKPVEIHLKLSNEAASAAFGRKLPVLFAADVELDERSAHLLFTKAEICG